MFNKNAFKMTFLFLILVLVGLVVNSLMLKKPNSFLAETQFSINTTANVRDSSWFWK